MLKLTKENLVCLQKNSRSPTKSAESNNPHGCEEKSKSTEKKRSEKKGSDPTGEKTSGLQRGGTPSEKKKHLPPSKKGHPEKPTKNLEYAPERKKEKGQKTRLSAAKKKKKVGLWSDGGIQGEVSGGEL